MSRVHQDDDFIYPSLDMSDEEEYLPSNTKEDETWNPKIKVSHLQLKTDRPTREGPKNVAIEKGLKSAAEKRGGSLLHPKKGNKLHKKRPSSNFLFKSSSSVAKLPSFKKDSLDIQKLAEQTKDKNRMRKGASTAKQRLGKILKLKF